MSEKNKVYLSLKEVTGGFLILAKFSSMDRFVPGEPHITYGYLNHANPFNDPSKLVNYIRKYVLHNKKLYDFTFDEELTLLLNSIKELK